MSQLVVATAVVAVAVLSGCSCGKKSNSSVGPSAEFTGLAAVPGSAEVIIGVNVAKVSQSPIIERAIDQLFLRETSLLTNWQAMREGCKIEIGKQVKHITLALGPTPAGGKPGTGPLLAVATGNIPEHDLAECITKLVGKGKGTVAGKDVGGRTVYQVKDGERMMIFAFGRADTVVLGNQEAFVLEALGTGAKAIDQPETSKLLKMVNQNAPIWAVGRIDERVRPGLVRVMKGKMKAGPTAAIATIDLTTGAKIDIGIATSSAEDAKALESQAIDEKRLMASAFQGNPTLGKLISKIDVNYDGSLVWLRVGLDIEDVNRVLNAIDARKPSEQISPPPSGSGSPSDQKDSPKNP